MLISFLNHTEQNCQIKAIIGGKEIKKQKEQNS